MHQGRSDGATGRCPHGGLAPLLTSCSAAALSTAAVLAQVRSARESATRECSALEIAFRSATPEIASRPAGESSERDIPDGSSAEIASSRANSSFASDTTRRSQPACCSWGAGLRFGGWGSSLGIVVGAQACVFWVCSVAGFFDGARASVSMSGHVPGTPRNVWRPRTSDGKKPTVPRGAQARLRRKRARERHQLVLARAG